MMESVVAQSAACCPRLSSLDTLQLLESFPVYLFANSTFKLSASSELALVNAEEAEVEVCDS
jgi:hypothetical protein